VPVRLILALMLVSSGGVVLPTSAYAHSEECYINVSGFLTCEVHDHEPVVPAAGTGRPQPPNLCGEWTQYIYAEGLATEARRIVNGVEETLYYRSCPDGWQYSWFRAYTSAEIAAVAYDDLRSARLPAPSPSFAPPAEAMLVNFDTWFAAAPAAPVTVRAEVPGSWATATATPTSIELRTGSQIAGDTTVVICEPWGSTTQAANGCTWTPRYPSVPEVTGTDDYRYSAAISIVWSVTWTSSSGASGTFPALRTATPVSIAVREIQTIGTQRWPDTASK
jgi:hypothetical protein